LLAGVKLANRITTFYERMGTVTDRDYDIVRSGDGLNTEYDLIAGSPEAMRTDIKSAIETLSPLEDIAYGRATEGELAKPATENRPSGRAAEPTRPSSEAPADDGLVDLENPPSTDADSDISW
jgi:hypothetical protein